MDSAHVVQASPDKGSHGKSARKRQSNKEKIEMNIKEKDRKEHTKGKYRQTEIQTERQIYKKCARMKERRQFFEEEDINTVMIMRKVKNQTRSQCV